MRSCNTCTILPRFGAIRSSAGPVSIVVCFPRSRPPALSYPALTLVSSCFAIDNPNDAFWLAQTYFLKHEYSRAERLLTRPFPTTPPKTGPFVSINGGPSQPPFAPAAANAKGKGREMPPPLTTGLEADGLLAPGVQRLPMGPGEMIDVAIQYEEGGVSRLVDMSVACRYLAAQCQMRQGKWSDALEMLGESNPFKNDREGSQVPNVDGGIKVCVTWS